MLLQKRVKTNLPRLSKQTHHLVPRFLQDARKRKAGKGIEYRRAKVQDACTQTVSATNEETENDVNEDASSNYRLKSLTSNRERTSSQLSSTTVSESTGDGSSHYRISRFFSRQEPSQKSIALYSARSSPTSIGTNSTEIHLPASELSTRIHFTGDAAENKTLALPPVNWLGYMTRGFKFSYFQYCSK